jgi:hypothetical protein
MNQHELIARWNDARGWTAKSHIEKLLIDGGSSLHKLRTLLPDEPRSHVEIRSAIRKLQNDSAAATIFDLLDQKLNPAVVRVAIGAAKIHANSKFDVAPMVVAYLRQLLAREIGVPYLRDLAKKRAVKPSTAQLTDTELIEALLMRSAADGDVAARADAQGAIRNALHEYRQRVIADALRPSRATVGRVAAACRILGLPMPSAHQPVDAHQLRQRKRVLARLYHPDVSGTQATTSDFNAVMNAVAVIETYNRTNQAR